MTRLTKADLKFFRRFKREYRVRVTSKVEERQLEVLYGPESLPDGVRLFTVARRISGGGVDYLFTANKKDADPDILSEDLCCALFWLIALKMGNAKRYKLEADV